ncbi:angio-associated migratory cell protein isoform X2 [Colletes latitarsis]
MIQKDIPPSSDMIDQTEDDDMLYAGDMEEVIDTNESENFQDEDSSDEDPLIKEDAICVFTGHKSGSIFCGSLTKSKKLAATGSIEHVAYVWDTSSGEIIFKTKEQSDSIVFSEFSSNEKYLAIGPMSGAVSVFSVPDNELIFCSYIGDVTWLKWHPTSSNLFVGNTDGDFYKFKIPTEFDKFICGYKYGIEIGAIFPDGKRAALGYADGMIKVIDLQTSSEISISSPLGHSSTITAIDCHPNNNLIISSDVDGKTILSIANSGTIISVLQNLNNFELSNIANVNNDAENADNDDWNNNWVEAVAFCKNPTFPVAATGTVNGEIFIWDISKQVLRRKIDQACGISKLVWKGNTHILFSAGLDGVLRCFDARSGQCLRSFTGHTADIYDLFISEDGENALTTSDDGTARIFDISSLP